MSHHQGDLYFNNDISSSFINVGGGCPHHLFPMILSITIQKSFLIQLCVQNMGNKATSSSSKSGKVNVRSARRTSVLLQQLTEPEIRSGQLFIKEHEYLSKEIIYIDQYLENLTIDMQAYGDVQEDSDEWAEKVSKYKEERSMKIRHENSMKRLKVVSSLIHKLKMDATSRIRKSGIEVSDPVDIALLQHLDTIIASSSEFLGDVGNTAVEGASVVLKETGKTLGIGAEITGGAISEGLTVIGNGAEVAGEAIGEGLATVGKEVATVGATVGKEVGGVVRDLVISEGKAMLLLNHF